MTTAVAVALYNGAAFIEKQLDTLRTQTLKPDTVVLCDDGSKDGTVGIVREYIERHGLTGSWRLYENEENLGYVHNFYKAISLCEADIVFLSDQDDIWKEDKLEKMTALMERDGKIKLLSCRYGIIDADGNEQHSVVEEGSSEGETVSEVKVRDIMRAYRWPGMVMAVRKDFFNEFILPIRECKAAHDFTFAVTAADVGGFYEYDYIGAYHRRHSNNVAREEHRVSKLLNLERKTKDINETLELYECFLNFGITLSDETVAIVTERKELLEKRKNALLNKSFSGIIKLYVKDKGNYLRMKSFICDVWLVLFGKKAK